jgi:type IV pilus assembly protein PilF
MKLMALSIVNQLITAVIKLGLIMVLSMITACVTTETGSVGSKADDKKALDYSVKLARGYIRSRNWDAAKRHLKNALEIDDSSPEVYEAMALVFQNTGEIELAEKNYKQAIKLQSNFSRVRNNYAAFLYQQRRYEEAADQLEVVVEDTLYDKRPAAYINLGRAYVQLKKLKKAEVALHRAYLMDRKNVVLMYELASLYLQLEDYPQSQQFYEGYRSQVKQQPPQALWLGIQLANKFGNQDALSSYALVLKNLYPNSKEYLEYKSAFGHAD